MNKDKIKESRERVRSEFLDKYESGNEVFLPISIAKNDLHKYLELIKDGTVTRINISDKEGIGFTIIPNATEGNQGKGPDFEVGTLANLNIVEEKVNEPVQKRVGD